jgi:endonuclease/exonuclease/phosphatase family metal-dependent hydrolase
MAAAETGRRHRRTAAVIAAALLVAGGCSDDLSTHTAGDVAIVLATPGPDDVRPEVTSATLRVMSFNIWLGGGLVDVNKVIEVIEAGRADIVGLQEAAAQTAAIADRLGWYSDERLHIISRFPLIHPPAGEGAYAYAQIAPGQVLAVANVHLPSDPYGPTLVRDGETLDAVLANEEATRVSALEPLLPRWQELVGGGIPLVVTGDFNSPSNLDWTEATVGALDHMKYVVEWPVTTAMQGIGLVDTFRSAHPDPVRNPGRTWTYGYPYPRVRSDEVIDRIDLVWASASATVIDSQVVGEPGTPDVDIEVEQYPSDHRAVVSTVQLDPIEPGPFVSVGHVRLEQGDTLPVRYHAPGGEATDRMVIVEAGADATGGNGIMWLPPMEASYFGQVLFGTGNLAPGAYDVALLTEGDAELSRTGFWVVSPGARASVAVASDLLAEGEPIRVTWSDAPARRFDWVGIYPAGELDLYNSYLVFAYTEATVAGSYEFGVDDLGDEMLAAGDYVAVLMSDDHYMILASAPFTVE